MLHLVTARIGLFIAAIALLMIPRLFIIYRASDVFLILKL